MNVRRPVAAVAITQALVAMLAEIEHYHRAMRTSRPTPVEPTPDEQRLIDIMRRPRTDPEGAA